MKSIPFYNHMSSQRDGWSYLEQDDDSTLHVRYENDDPPKDTWRKPINEFLANPTGASHPALLELIERMFASEK